MWKNPKTNQERFIKRWRLMKIRSQSAKRKFTMDDQISRTGITPFKEDS